MRRRFLHLWLPLLWCQVLLSQVAAAESLSLTASSWPPYIDREREDGGEAMAIVTNAFHAAGISSSWRLLPSWAEARESMLAGNSDVLVASWYTAERTETHQFSEPFMNNRIVFLVRKGSGYRYETEADLEGVLLGVARGYAYSPKMAELVGVYSVESNHPLQSILKLLNGEVDMVVGDERVLNHEIDEYVASRRGELEFLPKALDERPLYIAVARDHPRGEIILQQFQQGLAKLRNE